MTNKSIEVEQLKSTEEDLKSSLNDFLKKDEEIKKLFDMFEKALKTLTQENGELKEKTISLDNENENFKSLLAEYQQELKDTKEKLAESSKAYDQLNVQYERAVLRPTANFDSQSLKRSDVVTSEPKHYPKTIERDYADIVKSKPITEVRESVENNSEDDVSLSRSQQEYIYESLKPGKKGKRKEVKEVKNLEILRESNKLLKEQNESLRIRAMLMEERSKLEKEDIGKVVFFDQSISESLSKAITDMALKKKEKTRIPDSEESDDEKPRKTKSKSRKQKPVIVEKVA